MPGFQIPADIEFVGWSSNSRLLQGADRHEFEDRNQLLVGMRQLGEALERSVSTEIVYVGRIGAKNFGYWFGTDAGKNYVYALEFAQADWLEHLQTA